MITPAYDQIKACFGQCGFSDGEFAARVGAQGISASGCLLKLPCVSVSEGGLKEKSIDIMPLNMISGSHIKRGMARILLSLGDNENKRRGFHNRRGACLSLVKMLK